MTAWARGPHTHEAATQAKRKVALVVAVETNERRRVAEALTSEGLEVLECASCEPALALLAVRPPALVVLANEIALGACEAIAAGVCRSWSWSSQTPPHARRARRTPAGGAPGRLTNCC
jgi:hypothetical protein